MKRAISMTAVAAVLGAAAAAASAEPRVRLSLDIEGRCPDERTMKAALSEWAVVVRESSGLWTVRVKRDRQGRRARLALVDSDGARVLVRTIASQDCEALARAFDVIVRAHFASLPDLGTAAAEDELAEEEARAAWAAEWEAEEDGSGDVPWDEDWEAPWESEPGAGARPEPEPELESLSEPESEPEPVVAFRDDIDTDAGSGSGAGEDFEDDVEVVRRERPGGGPGRLAFALMAGLHGPLGEPRSAPSGRVEVGWRPGRSRWELALGFGYASALVEGQQPRRIETDGLRLDAAVGPRLESRDWYVRPALGLGLTAAQVTALDLAGRPTVGRWLPRGTGALIVARRLTGPLWVRAELAADVHFRRDLYVIDPLGAVAESPRFTGTAGVGLAVDVDLGIRWGRTRHQ